MNLVLAFMFQNERPWLEVMLPVLAAADHLTTLNPKVMR